MTVVIDDLLLLVAVEATTTVVVVFLTDVNVLEPDVMVVVLCCVTVAVVGLTLGTVCTTVVTGLAGSYTTVWSTVCVSVAGCEVVEVEVDAFLVVVVTAAAEEAFAPTRSQQSTKTERPAMLLVLAQLLPVVRRSVRPSQQIERPRGRRQEAVYAPSKT